ncbi:MAG: aminoacetone oxidase family FAD-binding enzyme [Candidatus Eisenbacteria bacterium]|nr:aminoacetone oxidase family FAD-binding enzyme [Candidatus Eisenbacteria bacterium]
MGPDVVVIGGGPAGLMAAVGAAGGGARVLVCERLPKPGRKLLASGGGRCNLTNTLPPEEFVERLGRDGRFALPALRALDGHALRGFFLERGVSTESPDGFRVYPSSGRSGDVLTALVGECGRLGVVVRRNAAVETLCLPERRLEGVVVDGRRIPCGVVIVATGGLGYPRLGGTGDGYALARAAGHRIREPVPALVGLRTKERWPRGCAGVAVARARVTVDVPRRRAAAEGNLLFTHEGISGQAVLDVSGAVAELLASRAEVPLRVSLDASADRASWVARLDGWRAAGERRSVAGLLSESLPRSLARAVCSRAGAEGLCAPVLPRAVKDGLADALSGLRLTAVGTGGFENAVVTRGGVALSGVDPETLESRTTPGLRFAGEVLDVDGPCGGFNLQWAFASGWLAGRSVCAGPVAKPTAPGR